MIRLNDDQNDVHHKVVLIGESGVGKTSLYRRFIGKNYEENTIKTIDVDFTTQSYSINESLVKLQIWDTAGQERYRSIIRIFLRDADAAILVYDLTDASSLAKGLEWINELRTSARAEVPVALLGNKKDLLPKICADQNEIDKRINELRGFALSKDLNIFSAAETSAKDDENLTNFLWILSSEMLQKKIQEERDYENFDLKRERRLLNLPESPKKCPC